MFQPPFRYRANWDGLTWRAGGWWAETDGPEDTNRRGSGQALQRWSFPARKIAIAMQAELTLGGGNLMTTPAPSLTRQLARRLRNGLITADDVHTATYYTPGCAGAPYIAGGVTPQGRKLIDYHRINGLQGVESEVFLAAAPESYHRNRRPAPKLGDPSGLRGHTGRPGNGPTS